MFKLYGVPSAETREFNTGAEKAPESIRKIGELAFPDISKQEIAKTIKCEKAGLIGGDHSITFDACKALDKEFTLIVFDAHADCWDNWRGKSSHATINQRISELPNCKKILLIGVRKIWDPELAFLNRTEKVKLIELKDIKAPKSDYWISIDLDVLDPTYAPAVDHTEPNGLSPTQLIVALKKLKTNKILGFDLVECVPDNSDTTSTQEIAVSIINTLCN